MSTYTRTNDSTSALLHSMTAPSWGQCALPCVIAGWCAAASSAASGRVVNAVDKSGFAPFDDDDDANVDEGDHVGAARNEEQVVEPISRGEAGHRRVRKTPHETTRTQQSWPKLLCEQCQRCMSREELYI